MAAQDLTTLDPVKAWLNIGQTTPDTSKDAILSSLITSCSTLIEEWCSRSFISASYSEGYNGTGTSRLILNETPITAVASLAINDQVVPASTDPLVYGYQFDENTIYLVGAPVPYYMIGRLTNSNVSGNNIFPMGNQNIQVSYTAGFATIPMGLQQACIDFVAHKFVQRGRIGMKSDHIGVSAQGSAYDISGIPDMVMAAIRQYRRLAPRS